jgi:fatty acid desaturase
MSQFQMALPEESLPTAHDEPERLRRFGVAIEAIRKRTQAEVGEHDLRYIRRVDRISRVAEMFGRTLIAVSPGPILFTTGVLSLWVYKQLQATEIGHMALHGAYNRIPGAGKFHSSKHVWQIPIDEQSWLRGHNGRHHGLTNVAGHDADIHFGPVRLTEHTPHRFVHHFQLPFTLLILFPNFGALMNLHFTGVTDVWNGNGRDDKFDFIEDRSPASVRDAGVRQVGVRELAGREAARRLLGRVDLLWPRRRAHHGVSRRHAAVRQG